MVNLDQLKVGEVDLERLQLYNANLKDVGRVLAEVLEITDKTIFMRYRLDNAIDDFEGWEYKRLSHNEFRDDVHVIEKVLRYKLIKIEYGEK